MKDLRLLLALALSALTCAVTAFGGPAPLRVVVIGAFVIFAPGLVLTHLLRISDALLSLVIMMMTGPSVWVLVATLAAFSGLWAPTATIVGAAALIGATCLLLLGWSLLPRQRVAVSAHRHERTAYPRDEAVITSPATHGATSGYDE